MKKNIFIVSLLFSTFTSFPLFAQNGNSVFRCGAQIGNTKVSVDIKHFGNRHILYPEGAASNEPQPARKRVMNLLDAQKVYGINHIIIYALKMNQVDLASVHWVVIYDTPNFDEDRTGVRTASFYRQNQSLITKGMYFGWAAL